MGEFDLLDETITSDYLDQGRERGKLKKHKKKRKLLIKEKDRIDHQISMLKSSETFDESTETDISLLKKRKKGIVRDIKKTKKKARDIRRSMSQYDDRLVLAREVEAMVNVDGLFRTRDIRYLTNNHFKRGLYLVGSMMNHRKPNFRTITSMIECIIGNLSLCNCGSEVINHIDIEILCKYLLRNKRILGMIDPIAVVVLNKWLILSGLNDHAIVYECDRLAKTTRFSTLYKKLCEGKFSFDQFVDFSKFQRRYMTAEQQIIFEQYQRIVRVMEDMGMAYCKSGKIKQRIRNGLRDLGIRKNQVGQIIHYTYDKTLDAARNYYAQRGNDGMATLTDYARGLTNFTPEFAGEQYAMSRF